VSGFLNSSVGVLALIATALVALGVIYRQAIRPVLHGTRRIISALEVVESQTKQLTVNGGSHLADDVKETRRMVEESAEREAEVKAALEAEQSRVRRDLDGFRASTAHEFEEVWRSLAVRDIYRAVDVIADQADRATGSGSEREAP
jgi:hypothetical protein